MSQAGGTATAGRPAGPGAASTPTPGSGTRASDPPALHQTGGCSAHSSPESSVEDPNTLNLDPDLGFVPIGSGSRVMLSILKEKIKNNFRAKQFSLQKYIFLERNVT